MGLTVFTYLIGFDDVKFLTVGLTLVWSPVGAVPSEYKPSCAWSPEDF